MTSLLNIAGNIPVSAAAAGAGQSLRFEDGDSAYLSFTPASAGNRRTWTWSGWVKRGNLTNFHSFFSAYSSSTSLDYIFFNNNDTLAFRNYNGTSYDLITNAVFRDPSAWYHIVLSVDTTQTTSSDRVKVYVNGETQSLGTATYPSQNYDFLVNSTVAHYIGYNGYNYHDGYLANVTFIDGTALTPTSFGEYDGTLWKPKSDADITSNLTFGTNGFYLPFKQTTEAEGFSTVTYSGSGADQSIEGVGFEPDLVWMKERTNINSNQLVDSVRGVQKGLFSDLTNAEITYSTHLSSFDSSGFTVGSNNNVNGSGKNYVAWCWDAGSGSAVSNTDGSITSSVKANTAKGFSIVSYAGGQGSNFTIGHNLLSAPQLIFTKGRSTSNNWGVYYTVNGNNTNYMSLNNDGSQGIDNGPLTGGAYVISGASTLEIASTAFANNASTMIAYCFHSVSGYSSIGSYSGTGATGNSITGLGFKPAWVMVKRTDSTGNWVVRDNTRSPVNPANDRLFWNLSNATGSAFNMDFDSDGFTLNTTTSDENASGGTYIYMAFADTRDATFFGDTSGNGNNWTPNALNNTDVVLDSPTNNWSTSNPLNGDSGTTWKEGNLELSTTSFGNNASTFFMETGKWYWEATGEGYVGAVCAFDRGTYNNTISVSGSDSIGYFTNGTVYWGTGTDSTPATYTSSDIIGVAVNMDDGQISFYKNNTLQVTLNFSSTISRLATEGCYANYNNGSTNNTRVVNFNFGQDSSFAGNKTAQGNTDDNGKGDFYYAPPSGFLALTTGNLPTPTITAPDEYFNTVLYTGNGSTQSITGVGFQPNWVWQKTRSTARSNYLQDVVRGAQKQLISDSTGAETSFTNGITSFDSDGFSVGSSSWANGNNESKVAWNWKAGGTAVSNTDGSITSQVSANQDAGFSVVSYTGTAANATVGHGLSSAPEMYMVKNRDQTGDWCVYHKDSNATPEDYYLLLNLTNAPIDNSTIWNDTAPTSTTFSIGSYLYGNNIDYIAYCFHSVEGYSKIGSYTGNGSTDGTYVHCGFRPAYVMAKRTDASGNSWYIWDNKRNSYNANGDNNLWANNSSAENTNDYPFDALSNGFKVRTTTSNLNTSGATYIFLAFAEAPFSKSNAR